MNPLRSQQPDVRWAVLLAGTVLAAAMVCRSGAAEVPPSQEQAEALMALDLEDLLEIRIRTVYGASKHDQSVTEAPASVTLVTREDIQQFGYRTLGDILNSVHGLYVTYDRGYQYVGIRGVNRPGDYGGAVLVTLNGHRLNEPVYDSSMVGQDFPLDVDLIERVEVIRGPGSVLFGNNAFCGVINVITRQGGDLQGAEISGSAGSFDTYSGRFSYGQRLTNGLEVLMSGTFRDSAGHDRLHYPEFSGVNGGDAENVDAERLSTFHASASYGGLSLSGCYGLREKHFPTACYGPGTVFNDSRFKGTDERGAVELKYEKSLEGDWGLMARVGYDRYSWDGTAPYQYDPTSPVITINRDRPSANWCIGEMQVSKEFAERLRLTMGLEGRKDIAVEQWVYDVDPPYTYIHRTIRTDNIGLYAQSECSVLTNLILNAGVRYDHYQTFGDAVNPRAGLISHPWQPTVFKLLYGQAYRAPNAYEFDYEAPGYCANHDLEPETIHSYEAVWEQQLSRPLRLSTALFYNRIEDQIVQVDETADPAVGGVIFRNLGEAEVLGVETELEALWASRLRGRVSYTYADAHEIATGVRLSNSPEHVAKLNLAVPVFQEKLTAGLELQAMSRRLSATTSDSTPGFLVANLTLFSRELVRGLELSASVYNLFDKRYYDPVAPDFDQQFILQDGRAFRVKLTYRF